MNGNTIIMNQNIVIVGGLHMDKWWCAKILIAILNGFICNVWMKKNCHRNGFVNVVE